MLTVAQQIVLSEMLMAVVNKSNPFKFESGDRVKDTDTINSVNNNFADGKEMPLYEQRLPNTCTLMFGIS